MILHLTGPKLERTVLVDYGVQALQVCVGIP